MKIIFLDIDGVLNNKDTLREGFHLWPDLIKNVISLCDEFSAKIVISSSWRICHTLPELRTILRYVGIPHNYILDVTPRSRDRMRGEEIKSWIDDHTHIVDSYIIIDDDSDMLLDQMPRLVHTTFDAGFDTAKLAEARLLFKDSSPAVMN